MAPRCITTISDDSRLSSTWPSLGIWPQFSLNREDLNLNAIDVCMYCIVHVTYYSLYGHIYIN